MKHLILATYPFYIGEKNNVSFHNEYKTIIRQIRIIGVKYIGNNIKTVIKQFSDLLYWGSEKSCRGVDF